MKTIKHTLAIFVLAVIAIPAWAGAPTDVMKRLDADGWKVMTHLKAIPEKYRKMAKATHHISITATDEKKAHVKDAKVTFEFVRKGKVVAKGEARYMGAMGGSHGMNSGHVMGDAVSMCGGACGG